MKKFLALSLSDVVFILLINVKMPTTWDFNIYKQDKFHALLELSMKKFYNLAARALEMKEKVKISQIFGIVYYCSM